MIFFTSSSNKLVYSPSDGLDVGTDVGTCVGRDVGADNRTGE